MADFKLDPNAMGKLEEEIQRNIERNVAPQVKRDQVDPLRADLNRIAQDPPPDLEETRRRVLVAYERHNLHPGEDVETLVAAVHAGEDVPDIAIRVQRPRFT